MLNIMYLIYKYTLNNTDSEYYSDSVRSTLIDPTTAYAWSVMYVFVSFLARMRNWTGSSAAQGGQHIFKIPRMSSYIIKQKTTSNLVAHWKLPNPVVTQIHLTVVVAENIKGTPDVSDAIPIMSISESDSEIGLDLCATRSE